MAEEDLMWEAAAICWNKTYEKIMNSEEDLRMEIGEHETSFTEGDRASDGDDQYEEPEPIVYDSREEELLAAIHDGNIAIFMEILFEKSTNLEYKDANEKTPVQIAIELGYSGMVRQLLKHGALVGDALLRAVDVGFDETIKIILNYVETLETKEERLAVLECHCMNDDFHPDVTPIVLAAQRNDFTMVKLLLDKNCKIPDMSKGFSTSATDSLQKSVGSLELYRGLSNEAYAVLSTRDPVDNAFVLSDRLQKLSKSDVEFKSTYLEFADNLNHIATDIISHARDTEEVLTVLSYDGDSRAGKSKNDRLAKLARAIAFEQKEFVAHPHCQKTVKSKFYGRMSYLLDCTATYRLVFFVLLMSSFPVLSLLYVLAPLPWIKTYVECPYVKFVLQMASDVFFVLILTIDTFINGGHLTAISLLEPTRLMLLAWNLGIGWQELKFVARRGVAFFEDAKHIRDTIIVVLFLTAITFDSIEYHTSPNPNVITLRESRAVDNGQHGQQNHENKSSAALKVDIIPHRIPNIPPDRILKNPGIGGSVTGGDEVFVPAGQSNKKDTFQQYLNNDWWDLHLLSSGLFALATVLALLRMLPYVVVSDVIGPLQISLGTMISQTLHFFVFIAVVFLAFGVGLTYIYSYFDKVNVQLCVEVNGANNCQNGDFANLFSGSVFLYWSVFGLKDLRILNLGEQAYILQFAGQTLYAMFYILLVLILLNALIAVMSNVYNEIEENADIEWKFATASMWMRYMSDGDVIPPPFNIIPSKESMLRLIAEIRRKTQRSTRKQLRNKEKRLRRSSIASSKRQKEVSYYQRVISHLVERYVASKTAGEVSVEAEINIADIRALKNDFLELRFEMYQRIHATTCKINKTINREGALIRNNSMAANAIFGMADQIHEEVHGQLEEATGFQSTVAEQAMTSVEEGKRLHTEWFESLRQNCTQTETGNDECTQTEKDESDECTQTKIYGSDECFQIKKDGHKKSTRTEIFCHDDSTQTEIYENDECTQTDMDVHDQCIQTEIDGRDQCVQTEIKGHDQCIQTKIAGHDECTQTLIYDNDECTQTEIHDCEEYTQTEVHDHDACTQTEVHDHDAFTQTEIEGRDKVTQTESEPAPPKKSLKGAVLAMKTTKQMRTSKPTWKL